MKKKYLLIISVLVFIICALLAYIFLLPEKHNNNNAQANETGQSESATIQEDEGDIVITIPDDQESAGE